MSSSLSSSSTPSSSSTSRPHADLSPEAQERPESQVSKEQLAQTSFKSFLGLAAVAGIILFLDQVTKAFIIAFLPLGWIWALTPGVGRIFRLHHISNTGAAFGLFTNQNTFFIIIALIVAAGIVYYYPRLGRVSLWVRLSLGLQLGGALGNLIDRIQFGYVVDFIEIGFWPIFNIADISIVTGVTILAICLWQEDDI